MLRRLFAAVITVILLAGAITAAASPAALSQRLIDATARTSDSTQSPSPIQTSMDRAIADVAKTQISPMAGLVLSQIDIVPLETSLLRASVPIKGHPSTLIKQLHVFRI